MAGKDSTSRRHRVIRLPRGNVPSATVVNVAEGATSRHGITVQLEKPLPPRPASKVRRPRR